jgi:hypothetical protein
MVLVGGFLFGGAAPVWAQEEPPKLDVPHALRMLGDQQVYRAPGAVAQLDEGRVLPTLDDKTRLLIAPYSGALDKGGNYADGEAHDSAVDAPLSDWAKKQKLHLIFVEGIHISLYGDPSAGVGPSNIPELRQVTAYLDVSSSVIFAARFASGVERDRVGDFDYPNAEPVAPSRERIDDLAARLRDNPVYNSPGLDDPVDPRMAQLAQQEYGIRVRIAAFPAPRLGEPIVDFGPELLKRFPGEVIMVSQGRWLDVTADQQAKANSARDYAYGRYEYASFTQGSPMQDRIGTVLKRLQFLLKDTAYGRPQPQPQPKAQPYDVRRTISGFTPWVLVGAALVLGLVGIYTWRRGQAERAGKERRAMLRERAKAAARIGDLGAQLLAVSERGDDVNPAAAERHSTARDLYDQALTAKAMSEVATIADEGIELGVS